MGITLHFIWYNYIITVYELYFVAIRPTVCCHCSYTVFVCFICVLSQMQVWDTAGQERFRTITQSYYRSAHGAMVAYDISRRNTFESVPHWIREVEQYGAASVVLILIGEKKHILSVSGSQSCLTHQHCQVSSSDRSLTRPSCSMCSFTTQRTGISERTVPRLGLVWKFAFVPIVHV